MFTNWVTGRRQPDRHAARQEAGGAARPDRRAARRSPTATCWSTPRTRPAPGIVGETMQFHGTADRYTLNGATHGRDALFDRGDRDRQSGGHGSQRRDARRAGGGVHLRPRAIGRLHAAGQSRPGPARSATASAPLRSDDLFFGGAQADYVDLNKVAIPQADEQQRLLANLIGFMNADRKPLPRFWYFPRGLKAVVVMTGDDHANNGTAGRFNIYNGGQPARVQRRPTGSASARRRTSSRTRRSARSAGGRVARAGLRDRRPHVDQRLTSVLRRLHACTSLDERTTPKQLARLRGRCSRRLPVRDQPHALHRVERLRHAAAGRAGARHPARHELLLLAGRLGERPSRAVHRLGHADAVRQDRRHDDRRVSRPPPR